MKCLNCKKQRSQLGAATLVHLRQLGKHRLQQSLGVVLLMPYIKISVSGHENEHRGMFRGQCWGK